MLEVLNEFCVCAVAATGMVVLFFLKKKLRKMKKSLGKGKWFKKVDLNESLYG